MRRFYGPTGLLEWRSRRALGPWSARGCDEEAGPMAALAVPLAAGQVDGENREARAAGQQPKERR